MRLASANRCHGNGGFLKCLNTVYQLGELFRIPSRAQLPDMAHDRCARLPEAAAREILFFGTTLRLGIAKLRFWAFLT